MLFGALFADAMGRDFIPALYPKPANASAGMYVRVFLRALGARTDDRSARAPSGRTARTAGA
jgi:hypothetical protein